MLQAHSKIANGDLVIAYHGYGNLRPLQVKGGQILHCKAGIFPHNAFIGAAFGTCVSGKSTRKDGPAPSLLLLRPTPELWTQALPRRTQIIYATDISVIVQNLRLCPGKTVAEAGTGSGSLTHSLAATVAPTGKVFTFDFHRARYEEAKAEFISHGLGDVVVSGWRDVCSPEVESDGKLADDASREAPLGGYGLDADSIDAVFLDVPNPWLAVDNVSKVLRENGVVCSFSPCIEQTQRLCEALRNSDAMYLDIKTVEVLTREHKPLFKVTYGSKRGREDETPPFAPEANMKGHSAFLTFARRGPKQ